MERIGEEKALVDVGKLMKQFEAKIKSSLLL